MDGSGVMYPLGSRPASPSVYAGFKYMLVLGSARVASVGASARIANREISFEIFGS